MNTFLTIVLAVLVAVFLGSVAVAEDNWDSHGGQGIYGPSISEHPSGGYATEGSAGYQSSFSGEVVSVDLSRGTLTIAPINEDEAFLNMLPEKVTISTDRMTKINLCDNSTNLADVNIGDNLQVQYRIKEGSYVAEDINSASC